MCVHMGARARLNHFRYLFVVFIRVRAVDGSHIITLEARSWVGESETLQI